MSKPAIIRVKDVMTREFDVVDGIANVADALRNANHLDNGCMIVNRRHDDDEFGILLLADVAKQIIALDKAPERVNVYEIMNKPMISVWPSMNIRYCARLFHKFGLSLAPVIKHDEIQGVVSYRKIVLNGLVELLKKG